MLSIQGDARQNVQAVSVLNVKIQGNAGEKTIQFGATVNLCLYLIYKQAAWVF